MTNTIKIRTITIKIVLLLLVMNLGFACSNAKASTPKAYPLTQTAAIKEKNAETITINGTVKAITFGKDGYTADVQANDGTGIYAALVSISNVGGPDKHKSCEIGDNVTFTGELSVSGNVKRLMVREIISITATINGIVKAITPGKDGYTAEVKTFKKGTYSALVSSANLAGGPDAYRQCKVGEKVSFKGVPSISRNSKSLMVTEIMSVDIPDTQMLISETGFRGIETGDALTKHGDYTKKNTMKTGEGSFKVYQIVDFENNPAGYFMVDPQNKFSVGDITVETPKASTEKGIKIGDTFKDLLKAYPNIKVHGSESEGRTYATVDNMSYRLDVPNFTYKVDKAKILAKTKITQIVIQCFKHEPAKLAAQYRDPELKSSYFIWQASPVLELHAKPSESSKVEGKHFAGENLNILETKMINNQLWVKVTYNLTIKAGYEDQFADGQVWPSGEPTGWIGGADVPIIRFK